MPVVQTVDMHVSCGHGLRAASCRSVSTARLTPCASLHRTRAPSSRSWARAMFSPTAHTPARLCTDARVAFESPQVHTVTVTWLRRTGEVTQHTMERETVPKELRLLLPQILLLSRDIHVVTRHSRHTSPVTHCHQPVAVSLYADLTDGRSHLR